MWEAAIDLHGWIERHRHLLKPPVGNKCLEQGDFIVMVVGGPNARSDYHYEEGPEFFYQLEGEMRLNLMTEEGPKEIPIRAGEVFYLPPRIPHSPQRMPGSVGLVIERKRRPEEKDGLMWFCPRCHTKLYEEFFRCATSNATSRRFSSVFTARSPIAPALAAVSSIPAPEKRAPEPCSGSTSMPTSCRWTGPTSPRNTGMIVFP